MEYPGITWLTLTPAVGALVVVFGPSNRPERARRVGLGVTLLALAQALLLWAGFEPTQTGMQWVERHAWIPSLGAEYFTGVDGMGMLMVLLSALVVPFGLLAAWRIEHQVRAFVALLLFLQTGLFGAFTALNFFHWFIFWEVGLIPAYFLIKLWGGRERTAAATQFFVYTMAGSVAMLLGFVAIYVATDTFDFLRWAEMGTTGELASRLSARLGWDGLSDEALALVIFCLVVAGFAVKVPLFPFHTWLPATYAEAPTGVAMVLTGAMSKMGVYGFVRLVLPLFPDQLRAVQTPLLWVAVGTIVLSALAAFSQKDLKRMIAYSSINHLGYCMLGIFAAVSVTGLGTEVAVERAAVLSGVLLQMFNHGITAAALFWFVGRIEIRAEGCRGVEDFGGLRQVAPVFCGLMGITLFASLGLPGLNGFIGEFLIFKGAFPLAGWAAVLSLTGLLATALFLLTILQRVFSGPLPARWAHFGDLTAREIWVVAPSIALMFGVGLYPQSILELIQPAIRQLVGQMPG